MYANVRNFLWVGEGLSDDFQEKVGVHHGSAVLTRQLFNIMLDALSQKMGKFELSAFTRK